MYSTSQDELIIDHTTLAVAIGENKLDEGTVRIAEERLADLPDVYIDKALKESDLDPEAFRDNDGTAPRPIPAIVWAAGAAIIGALGIGALIFTAKYNDSQERQQLVNKCFEKGGTPVIDSKDSAGISAGLESVDVHAETGFHFECRKA